MISTRTHHGQAACALPRPVTWSRTRLDPALCPVPPDRSTAPPPWHRGCASYGQGTVTPTPPPLPQPTDLERRVAEGGWLIELLLPRTDAGVAVQAVVVAAVLLLLLRPARRAGLLQLWVGVLALTAGLFVLRGAH